MSRFFVVVIFKSLLIIILLVDTNSNCPNYDPVCDTDGETHSSLCHMIKSNRKLAYYGPCSKLCRDNGDVCGINGITYRSECEAWSGNWFLM